MKHDLCHWSNLLISGCAVIFASCGDTGRGAADTDSDSSVDSETDSDADGACDEVATADVTFDTEYDIGPDQMFAEPGDVPWESLAPGTLVRIHYRDAPYAAKWVLNTVATEDKPVVVRGILDDEGKRPIITGQNAVTRVALSYWNENRSVIKIGGSNLPSDDLTPAHIHLENLDIRSARLPFQFTNDDGDLEAYAKNAASVHIERGNFITVRNCVIRDSGNGIFSGHRSENVLITGNHVYDNGIKDSIYEHNSYTESFKITFQYNYYGPLRTGCLGNNLKDRSAGTMIRYNWIESGNRQLDLVESDYDDFVNDPSYQETFVYGNVLIEPDGAGNSQIVHYGGDGGDESMYRTGILHFYNNTVVSTRNGNTTLFRLSTGDVEADVRNNIFYPSSGGGSLAVCSGTGNPTLRNNWLPTGWTDTHESAMTDGVVVDNGNILGTDPGFVDAADSVFTPSDESSCVDAAGPLQEGVPAVLCEYVSHFGNRERTDDGSKDVGAFEAD